jgi:hypothetical protein
MLGSPVTSRGSSTGGSFLVLASQIYENQKINSDIKDANEIGE